MILRVAVALLTRKTQCVSVYEIICRYVAFSVGSLINTKTKKKAKTLKGLAQPVGSWQAYKRYDPEQSRLPTIGPSKTFDVHPGKLTWNPKKEAWKMMFIFNWIIPKFHVNFSGVLLGTACFFSQTNGVENQVNHLPMVPSPTAGVISWENLLYVSSQLYQKYRNLHPN